MLGLTKRITSSVSKNIGRSTFLTKNKSFSPVKTSLNGLRSFATSSGFPSYLTNIPPTKVSTLPNNMRVATEEHHGEIATVGVYIDAGTVYETEKTNGVAHFLEHMTFKGTGNRSREKFEVEIENIGASLNAYTSREQTVYYMKVFKNDVPKAVEILSDILTNPSLDAAAVEAERGTILRELEEVNKDPGETIFDHLHSAAFQGTPMARTILGPAENIKRIKREDIVDYIKNNYHGPRMVLAGAGAVKHEELAALGQKHFGNLPNVQRDPSSISIAKPEFTGSMVTVRDDNLDAAHVVIAVEGVNWSSPDYYTFLVIQQIIGSWDRTIGGGKNLSSALCEKIATDHLARSITTFNTCYNNTGLFGVYAITDNANLDDCCYYITKEWNRIGKTVLDSDVERAKARLKSSLLMSLDGSSAICDDMGRQMLTVGRRLTPAEIFMRIDAITTKDVMRVMREHVEDTDPAVVAIGQISNMPDYSYIRDWTYWRRW